MNNFALYLHVSYRVPGFLMLIHSFNLHFKTTSKSPRRSGSLKAEHKELTSGLKLLHGTVYSSLVYLLYSAWNHDPGRCWCHEAPPEVLVSTNGLPGSDDKVHAGPETAGDVWTEEDPQSSRWGQTERLQPARSCSKKRFVQSESCLYGGMLKTSLFVFFCSSRWMKEAGGTDSGRLPQPSVSRRRKQRRTRTTRV